MLASTSALVRRDDLVVVVIDIQERLSAVMTHRQRVVSAAVKMARTAALVGAPVIATRQYPEGLGSTDDGVEQALVALAEAGGRVITVDKTAFCCSAEEEFREALAATGRRQVVLSGMETHICVAQTAIDLTTRGFEVQVAADACCSRDDDMHHVALARLRHAGVVVTTSESVMYEAIGRAATDEFRELLAIVKG
jgi:nicotinamidase-related amidase